MLYRDKRGRYSLITESCPHPRASLALGIPTNDGIRCPYHGWAFGHSGQCLEQLNEPEVTTQAYSVEEMGGLEDRADTDATCGANADEIWRFGESELQLALPGPAGDDRRNDRRRQTTRPPTQQAKMLKYCAAIAIGIFLFVATEPSSAQPSREYFDSDRSRTQKRLNARIRKQIEADCKANAKKFYSAIHFQKRRAFVKDCIERSLVPLRRGLMGLARGPVLNRH